MTRVQSTRLRHLRATLLDGAIADFEGMVGQLGEPLDSVVAKLCIDVRALVNAEGGLSDSILVEETKATARLGRLPTNGETS